MNRFMLICSICMSVQVRLYLRVNAWGLWDRPEMRPDRTCILNAVYRGNAVTLCTIWGCRMTRRLRIGVVVFRDPMLLCGVLYLLLFLDAGGWMRIALLAAVLHEGGHILVYCLQVHRLPMIEVTVTGFCMCVRRRLTRRQKFWLAAAGPGTNLALAVLWWIKLSQNVTVRDSAFWAANLLTGAFNLLPIPPLDGAQMLQSVLECVRNKKPPGNDCKKSRFRVQ